MMTLLLLRQQRHLVAVDAAPAVCAHDLHVVYEGQRLGLVVHPSGASASMVPCTYLNEDGL